MASFGSGLDRLAWMIFLTLTASHFAAAAGPDLALAPPPDFSQAAWQEIIAKNPNGESTTIKVRMHVLWGQISDAQVVNPTGMTTVENELTKWIRTKWKFNRDFSGDLTQPVAVAVPKKRPDERKPVYAHRGPLLRRSPKPPFPTAPYGVDLATYDYNERTGKTAMSVARIKVRNGAMTDIRVLYQTGPADLSDYLVRWIRRTWEFYPDVTGTFDIPVRFAYGHQVKG
jgi:hypothetical protein